MAERPNLIYIMADQLRYQSCGFAGDGNAQTPNMDRLAALGASFRQAVSGHPVCAPYRASLFTGKYSSSTGMVINELRMNPRHTCFAHVLSRNGYRTAYIGKWHLWANELGNHGDPKNSYTPPGPYRLGFDGYWAAYNFHHQYYRDAYYHTDSPERIRLEGYEPDGQTDLAIQWLTAQKSGGPFALFLSYGTPHDPWDRDNLPVEYYEMFRDARLPDPPNFSDEDDPYADAWARGPEGFRKKLQQWRRIYDGMTANLDGNLGRVLSRLDELGIAEDTLVVFTSDHGEMFGAHGRRGKNIFYEEAVRVPFILRRPNRIPEGRVTDALLNTPDIMPTLLSLLGLAIPDEVEGIDLSHCALAEPALAKPGPEPTEAFLQGMGTTAAWTDGHEWRAIRTNRYTYAVYRKDGRELLFDNRADPYQMENLADRKEHAGVLADLRAVLKNRMQALGDTFEKCTWYRDHWTKDRIILQTATLQREQGGNRKHL